VNIEIRPEIPTDREEIWRIHQLAFGQPDEAKLVDALRDGGYGRVSLVAWLDEIAVGHILFSDLPIITPERVVPALSLAPLAVLPERQRHGIGAQLVRAGLEACRVQGHGVVIVLGNPAYYGRFGFSLAAALPLDCCYAGEYFQAVELFPGALAGVRGRVEYPPPFAEL
jgi:putative acetyltransferase